MSCRTGVSLWLKDLKIPRCVTLCEGIATNRKRTACKGCWLYRGCTHLYNITGNEKWKYPDSLRPQAASSEPVDDEQFSQPGPSEPVVDGQVNVTAEAEVQEAVQESEPVPTAGDAESNYTT